MKEKNIYAMSKDGNCRWISEDELDPEALSIMNKRSQESQRINSIIKAVCSYAWYAGSDFEDTDRFCCRYFIDNHKRHDNVNLKRPYTDEELMHHIQNDLCEGCFGCDCQHWTNKQLNSSGISRDTGHYVDHTTPEQLQELTEYIKEKEKDTTLDDLIEIAKTLPPSSYKEVEEYLLMVKLKHNLI